jgi:GDP-L-fucose synthase
MVGSAVWRELERRGFGELVGWPSSEVDLRDRDAAFDAIVSAAPDVLILAAAKVGGIWANASQPVEFLNDNLRIQTNVFEAALAACTDKLVFLGSSCVYPKFATQPIQEKELLSGPLEPTNAAYAIAKIAGIEGVRAYRERFGVHWISLMPCNIYGPYDNFDPENSHVLPALIRRFAEASHFETPEVSVWGSGEPRREFLHVDDLAQAVLHMLEVYDASQHVNIGYGSDIRVRELVEMLAAISGFEGQVLWDESRPDGTPAKLLDSTVAHQLGWRPGITLQGGLEQTYRWYLEESGLL